MDVVGGGAFIIRMVILDDDVVMINGFPLQENRLCTTNNRTVTCNLPNPLPPGQEVGLMKVYVTTIYSKVELFIVTI